MRSLELNRLFYQECVAPVLEEHCPTIAQRHAAALMGWGSEVLGNDDDFSKRYGWGPRVILFLEQGEYTIWKGKLARLLEDHIPPTFLAVPTRYTDPTRGAPRPTLEAGGVLQVPITTCERFCELYLGLSSVPTPAAPLSSHEWLLINEASLLRLTSGEVYHDGIGELSWLRHNLHYFPDDVWRYRLAYQWTALSWDIDLIGLCAHRGDALSARIAAAESVRRIIGLVFLLNRTYQPGYQKWLHRQFYKLPRLADEVGSALEGALTTANCASIPAMLYPVLDRLIEFQGEVAGIMVADYKQPAPLDPGFFAYDLQIVIDAIWNTIRGELCQTRNRIGALDQWVNDQDVLMSPPHLRALETVYALDDPLHLLRKRNRSEDRFL
ncbi:MAG: DUF4037 domain-containing protein [Chloroflexi bacterium]|nr:DUF4037 domain-containing protein [Chloroflexota bacterium]